MHALRARNVNDAYPQGIAWLTEAGASTLTPDKGVIRAVSEPVTTHYSHPTERVLFDVARNVNPFFYLFESLWLLTGADVGQLPEWFTAPLARNRADGVDRDHVQHGAYRNRWALHAQVTHAIRTLSAGQPMAQQAVLTLWDPTDATPPLTRRADIPCNIAASFGTETQNGRTRLNMAVLNRGNDDIVTGAYGANGVQLSVLHEYIALSCGMEVGWYEHTSFHYYTRGGTWTAFRGTPPAQPYVEPRPVCTVPLFAPGKRNEFDEENTRLRMLVQRMDPLPSGQFQNKFLRTVALPMVMAYRAYTAGVGSRALDAAIAQHGRIDWLVAGLQWLERRNERSPGTLSPRESLEYSTMSRRGGAPI